MVKKRFHHFLTVSDSFFDASLRWCQWFSMSACLCLHSISTQSALSASQGQPRHSSYKVSTGKLSACEESLFMALKLKQAARIFINHLWGWRASVIKCYWEVKCGARHCGLLYLLFPVCYDQQLFPLHAQEGRYAHTSLVLSFPSGKLNTCGTDLQSFANGWNCVI